jgi:tetratricopeptide (TPR) repeat protein
LGSIHPPTHEDAAWLLSDVGMRRHHLAEWSLAEPLYRRALAIDEQSYGNCGPMVSMDINNLAVLLPATNRLAEAKPLMRRSLAIREKSWGARHPSTANGQVNFGQLLLDLGREQEAEALLRQALDVWEQSQTPNDPGAGKAHLALGEIGKRRGNVAVAKQHLQEAIRLLTLASGNYPRELELARQTLQSLD